MRYDKKTKDQVVKFVREFNEKNGRGGQSAAVKKWSLNPITVRSWLDKAGVATPGKKGKKRVRAAGKPPAAASRMNSRIASLRRMADLQEKIAVLQAEYDSLKATL